MPIPNTRAFLCSIIANKQAVLFTPSALGDYVPPAAGDPVAVWLASNADMNGGGRTDLIFRESSSGIRGPDCRLAGVELASLTSGCTLTLDSAATRQQIDLAGNLTLTQADFLL